MGIYIKGVDMPSGCISCPFKSYGTVDEFKYYCDITGAFVGSWESKKLNQRHKDCPLLEEKTGKWKPFDLTYGRNIYFCTACNNASEVPTSMGEPVYKFCPWCGARMVDENE